MNIAKDKFFKPPLVSESESPQVSESDTNRLNPDLLFEELKDVLLREDRAALQRIKDILDDPKELSTKVSPVLEDRLLVFKEAFPDEYRHVLDGMISQKLKESQDELLETIFPVMGKMIKKYISLQFELVKEKIDQAMRVNVWGRTRKKFKSMFYGVKVSDQVLHTVSEIELKEIYIIQKYSGLLIASTDTELTQDSDLIAGMVTAIKSFAEDAFDNKGAELETIGYDSYQLLLESYYSYYFVLAVSGTPSASDSDRLHKRMDDFASTFLKRANVQEGRFSLALSIQLKEYFKDY